MFDTVAAKLEGGPFMPNEDSRNEWETRTREFHDRRLNQRRTSVTLILSRPEARLAIMAGGAILYVESSLPKLQYGNNLASLVEARPALDRLHAFASQYLTASLPDISEWEYLRVDYCHNFRVGSQLPDYVHALGGVQFLKHRRITDGHDGVEWWGDNGRRVRAYDKHHEILEQDKTDLPEARGVLRFEVQIRKKSRFLHRRLKKKNLSLLDVLDPLVAYRVLVETLNRMCLDSRFVPLDRARAILDQEFSYRKANRLLGVLRRLESQRVEDLKNFSPRSTFYKDKLELRRLGLFPLSTGIVELPGLQLPRLEEILPSSEAV